MNLLYLSCHSILEYDDLTLFTELGIDCFSHGAYLDPIGSKLLPRPSIPGMKAHPELEEITRNHPEKTFLPQEVIDWADVIFIVHTPEWVSENWPRIKHKKVIWRSIGQSNKHVENMIRKSRYEGLKIVRYSPKEALIPDYLGSDAMIRFYKDPEEFKDWNGNEKRVINFTQSLKGRRYFCHYDDIMQSIEGFPAKVFGTGNDDLGPLNGGELPFSLLKGQLRDNRVFFYGGTWPAAYTLAFMEAMMTGIPIVSIGKEKAERITGVADADKFPFFEVPEIIENGVTGFFSDDIQTCRQYIHSLLEDHELAKRISVNARARAIELFGKENIKKQWKEFFDTL